MQRRTARSLAALAAVAVLAAGPAPAQPPVRTELVARDGSRVEALQLRHDFNAVWVIDTQKVLFRDDARDYYLVSLSAPCAPLGVRSLSFGFHPAWSWRLLESRAYEVRPEAGGPCGVARVEQMDDVRARPLRAASLRRVW